MEIQCVHLASIHEGGREERRLAETMGLNETHLLCSSMNQHCIPLRRLLNEEASVVSGKCVHVKNQGVLDLFPNDAKIKWSCA